MGKIIYNKLVRDKIPEIIESNGHKFKTHIGDEKEYKQHLLKKLIEEANEFQEEPCLEELADILEVIDNIKVTFDFNDEDVEKVKEKKRNLRGGFNDRIILDYVIE